MADSSQNHPSATLQDSLHDLINAFWQGQLSEIESGLSDFKFHQLPLARIKKVMKADEDVKMISSEAPLIFSKACEIFILELTMRAWVHTEENKRRTLQKSDVALALTKADMYDFLIDIVPRETPMGGTTSSQPTMKMPYTYFAPSPTQFQPQQLTPEQQQAYLAYVTSQQQQQQQQHQHQQQLQQKSQVSVNTSNQQMPSSQLRAYQQQMMAAAAAQQQQQQSDSDAYAYYQQQQQHQQHMSQSKGQSPPGGRP